MSLANHSLAVLQAQATADGRQPIVGALIANQDGHIFAQRRHPTTSRFPGCWDIVGGHVEPGESLAEALSREVREETGWELTGIRALFLHFDWESAANGRVVRKREFHFLVDVAGDLSRPALETSKFAEWAWIAPETLHRLHENRAPGDTVIYDVVRLALQHTAPREQLDLYDTYGRPLNRTILRGEQLRPGEFVRVAHVWVRDTKGRFLIQRRADHLPAWPGIWATTAGVVQAGESPIAGALRELREEVGLAARPEALTLLDEVIFKRTLTAIWLLKRDAPLEAIRFQAAEVGAVRWADTATIRAMIAAGRFFDYGPAYFDLVFNRL